MVSLGKYFPLSLRCDLDPGNQGNDECGANYARQNKITTRNRTCTHHVYELAESEAELDGEFVGVVGDGADEFVVAVATQQIVVEPLGVRVAVGTCNEKSTSSFSLVSFAGASCLQDGFCCVLLSY